MPDSDNTQRNILRDKKVQKRTGLGRVQRWRRIKAGTFPPPVQLGPNSIGWYEDEIDQWLADRPRVNYAPAWPIDTGAALADEERDTHETAAEEHSAANPSTAPPGPEPEPVAAA